MLMFILLLDCSNLIDVSQEHVVLDEKDVEERIQKYSQHFSNTDAARVAFSRLVNAIHGMPPCKFAEEIDEMQLQQILRDSREIGLKTDSVRLFCHNFSG